MTLTTQIRKKIKNIPEGKTFRYVDLGISKEQYATAAKVLERLQKEALIKKMSKGIFYRPQQTVFGELAPDYYEQLKPYLFMNGKRIAYETGYSLYNSLGLTTQMAFKIKIASRTRRISINKGVLKVDTVKSYTDVTEANYKLLGLLDALKDIKNIPDCTVRKAVLILNGKFKKLNEKQIIDMIKYAGYYPPRVRALLGAILQNNETYVNLDKLKNSLNPMSKYKLGLKEKDLPTIKNWNIE